MVALVGGAILSIGAVVAVFVVPSLNVTEPAVEAKTLPPARVFMGPITTPVIEGKEGRRGIAVIHFIVTVDGASVARFCSIEPMFLDVALMHFTKRTPRRGQRGSIDLSKSTADLRQVIVRAVGTFFDAKSLGDVEAHTTSAALSAKKYLKLLKVNFVCKAGEAEKV